MLRCARKLWWVLLLSVGIVRVGAFSLIGPLEAWQTSDIGYAFPDAISIASSGEVAGPKNLGEEYRWNFPTIVYGFDASFLEYFGQRGVEAVEAAIKILNALPAASEMSEDLHEFPLDTRRINYQASALRIRDMKSWTLSALLEAMGLGAPERYVYTLRSRTVINLIPVYVTIKRNFDPITREPSAYVNGTLYTYVIQQTRIAPPLDAWEAVSISVDPFQPTPSSVSAYIGMYTGAGDPRGQGVLFNPGLFYTGLTRDDAGGVKYLLRSSNLNVENLPTNSIAAFSSGGLNSSSGTSGGGLPWAPVGGANSGQTTGGAAAAPGGAAGGAVAGGGTNSLVDLALRPGVDKLKFARANFDSLLGAFIFTNNTVYTDTYMTKGVLRKQLVQRTMAQPDILFSAADLGIDTTSGEPFLYNRTLGFQNNEANNSAPGGTALAGPGLIASPVEITFSKLGQFFLNIREGGELRGSRSLVWGSYDASTNAPIVFPSGVSIQDLERIVFTQNGGASPWRLP